jgi:hypothetical protein
MFFDEGVQTPVTGDAGTVAEPQVPTETPAEGGEVAPAGEEGQVV